MSYKFYMPTKLLIGKDSLKELHKESLPFKKALIVTTNGKSIYKYGYMDILLNELKLLNIDYVIYSKILPNPIKEHVMEASEIAKTNNCDVIIGIGGGSAIDSAKAISVMVTNPGDYWDYIEGGTGLNKPLVNKPLSVIAITTTSGTGTESDPWTVITNGEEKIGYGNDLTFPYLSIVDPMLTLSIPKELTMYQGFDALFHAMEGYINIRHNEISDMFALKSVSLISKYLPIVIKDLNNIEARSKVSLANTLSGIVETLSGCTAEHSIAHAISGVYPSIIHGEALMSITLAYFKKECDGNKINNRLIDLAIALGKKDAKNKEDILIALKDLINKCDGNNVNLTNAKVNINDLDKIVENAFTTMGGLFKVDPTKLTKLDVLEILKESI